jgi:Na+/H+ antiporter NhaD/arsenite permease-like protein
VVADGDVTTTMLWIGGQITALAIIKSVILPALVSMVIPLAITAYVLRGKPVESPVSARRASMASRPPSSSAT